VSKARERPCGGHFNADGIAICLRMMLAEADLYDYPAACVICAPDGA
jgi:hypothetical protein